MYICLVNDQTKIIYLQYPTNPFERNKTILMVIAVVVLLGVLIGNVESGLIVMLFFLLIAIASDWIESPFDGWEIGENYFLIRRINLTWKETKVVIPYADILEITFIERSKAPSCLKIKTSQQIYTLVLQKGIFHFAPTLLFLKKREIPVSLKSPDHELQLFLDGKIDSFPIHIT